jgi:hypothetical protein
MTEPTAAKADNMTGLDEMSRSRVGLVTEFVGSASRDLDMAPPVVLEAVTDVMALPGWNAAIESVAEAPEALVAGSQWVVVMHPPGWPRWRSRSTVDELDRDAHRFVFTTQTDDDNPSRAHWTWQVASTETGSKLTVSWRVYPRTFGRRSVLARLRRPQLQGEVQDSLDALAKTLQP